MTPIIDCEGMFGGDRMAKLSDRAKLFWPWLYLASNGYARFEINYRRILQRVFSGFADPPTEEQFVAYLKEYCDAYLLFTYRAGGQLWGQWDTSAKCLPRHKTTSDERSPIPPADEYVRWREEYAATKCEEVPLLATFAEKRGGISRDFAGFRDISREEKRREEKRIEEKNLSASSDAGVDEDLPIQPPRKTKREIWFDEKFWPIVWLKTGRKLALKTWMKTVKSEDDMQRIIEAAVLQGPSILARGNRPGCSVLHPSTWLSDGRYEDEPTVGSLFSQPQVQQNQPIPSRRYIPVIAPTENTDV